MRVSRAPRSSRAATVCAALSLAAFTGACRDTRTDAPGRAAEGAAAGAPAPVAPGAATGATANIPADDGQWLMAPKDHAATRYSSLAEINTTNVGELRSVWSFSTGVLRGHEAAPLVVNNVMYIVTPFPNLLHALDLTRPGAPLLWTYDPKPSPASQGIACCDVVNRGAAYADGRIIYNTLDAHTVAVDAATGREVWRTRMGDISRGETMTMAPLVVKGKALVGNSGGEYGVRGWIAALDVATGREVWRAYSTGPDSEMLIGADFQPFYPQDRGTDLGVHSWPPDGWRTGGGTVWGWVSYDPELDLIYYGTGNPGPWNPEQRPGDNKWTAGVIARNPDTGMARWAYQWSPHDKFDHDGVNENILLELPINGTRRRVLLRPERNGYIYVLDRATGEVLSADVFAHNTISRGVDLRTGRMIEIPEKEPKVGRVVRDICPPAPGAKDWQPSAFSPRTGLVYIPHQNMCMDMEAMEANYIAGTPYVGAAVVMRAGPGGHRGEFTAWDPVNRRKAWVVRERFPVWSGALVTAGDVVFYGTMEGWFKAFDARTGELLWEHKLPSGIISQPISYRGPDGKQYIAVLAGVGGWPGAIVAGGLDPRDSSAALGFVNAMRDLPDYTMKGGSVHAFALP